jgi:signal transduction histidine kinase
MLEQRMQYREARQRTTKLTLEQRLALKFTWLVCGLILISGTIFATSDVIIGNYRTTLALNGRITRILANSQGQTDLSTAGEWLSYQDRPFTRILAPDGMVLYQGDMFAGSGPGPVDPFVTPRPVDESSAIVTQPIRHDGRVVGYIQLAGRTRQGMRDLGVKLVQMLVVTLVMGILTYLLGLSFSKQTLRPVHESQDRLEQFTQDASHELRTPLASISSSLDVAMKTGEYRDGIMAAKGQIKYASLLVERLLEVAELDRAKADLGQVDLTALVAAVASQNVESCKEHELTMQATIHEGVTVEGDSLLLRQLVNNLIENAVKFNAPGGTVSVLLNATDLHVGNSGGFITPDDLSHVFEPFYQVDTSRTQRGFGLGLAIVKKIAGLHGWHVAVTSTAEAGTDFIVRFT